MTDKLKNYQVIDVGSDGVFYKVKHKVSGETYMWKACDCSDYSDEQIQNIVNEVKILNSLKEDTLIKYYDTILHRPSKTLYFVLEYHSWKNLEEIICDCKRLKSHLSEEYIWCILHEITKACKIIYDLKLNVIKKFLNVKSVFIDENGGLKLNSFDLISKNTSDEWNIMQEIAEVIYKLAYLETEENGVETEKEEFRYSDDLKDVLVFLLDEKNTNLKPAVLLYHPTVLANVDGMCFQKFTLNKNIFVASNSEIVTSSKCDADKVLDICKSIDGKNNFLAHNSPIYLNLSPNKIVTLSTENISPSSGSLSPTLAALALELPGFIPRRRNNINDYLTRYREPQQVSEETLSKQWMSRLLALREREESLNVRERKLIAKEILNSPAVKIAILPDDLNETIRKSLSPERVQQNGITLPPMIVHKVNEHVDDKPTTNAENIMASKRYHRRSNSVRTRQKRRKSYSYEDMDSSLSADPGDGSIMPTTTRFDNENMPRRNIFPNAPNKKVHFTNSNPFTVTDDSVTLTFYELENVDRDGYQVPRNEEYSSKHLSEEINKFKYLDLERITSEKRAAMQNWIGTSPKHKFAIPNNEALTDITNKHSVRQSLQPNILQKVPSKSSLVSKTSNNSNTTKYSTASSNKSAFSLESDKSKGSFKSCLSTMSSNVKGQALKGKAVKNIEAPFNGEKVCDNEKMNVNSCKKSKIRKSLISFKTPFKFR